MLKSLFHHSSLSPWATSSTRASPEGWIPLPSQVRRKLEGLQWGNPFSRPGEASGLSFGKLPPGEQPFAMEKPLGTFTGTPLPSPCLSHWDLPGSSRGEPGGAPGDKTQDGVGIPQPCGHQELLALMQVLTQAPPWVSVTTGFLPAAAPTRC